MLETEHQARRSAIRKIAAELGTKDTPSVHHACVEAGIVVAGKIGREQVRRALAAEPAADHEPPLISAVRNDWTPRAPGEPCGRCGKLHTDAARPAWFCTASGMLCAPCVAENVSQADHMAVARMVDFVERGGIRCADAERLPDMGRVAAWQRAKERL